MKHLNWFLILLALSQPAHSEDGKDLFAAAIGGKLDRTEALLAQGIDVNSKTGSGRTALMAASFNGNSRIVKALLAYGADVNLADSVGTTALMDALVFGNEEIVNLLIAAGADVNAVDNQKATVLARAKKSPHENIVKLLEKAGAKAEEQVPIEEAPPKEGAEAKPGDKPADPAAAKPPAEKK